MALITLEEYKAFYNITATTDDISNQVLIDIAITLIDGFIGRSLESTVYTDEEYDGGVSTIVLDATPVISIGSFTAAGVDVVDYSLYKANGMLRSGSTVPQYYSAQSRFAGGIQDVLITYTAGYVTIPEDVKYCTYILTKKLATGKTSSSTSSVKRQRLHGEDREFFRSSSSNKTTAVSTMGNEVVAILRNYI